MSGHKRATIILREPDRNRFTQACRQLEIIEEDYNEIRARVQQIQRERLRTTRDALQVRQDHFAHSLVHLDNHLQWVENEVSLAIADQANQLQSQLDHLGDTFWQHSSNLMESQSRSLQKILDESVAQQQAGFASLHQKVATLKQQQDTKRRIAIEALRSANELFESLQNTYDLERYNPGLAQAVINDLGTAQQNIVSGFYEAGLVSAQAVYTRTSAARVEIENYLLQHSLATSAALAKGYEVLGKFEAQSSVNAIDLNGEALDVQVDVDYWSWGAWRDRRRHCLRLVERLQRNADQFSIEEINASFKEILDYEEALPEIVSQARQNILSSQVRYNLAECIVNSLQEQGFYLDDSQYEDSDQRQPYLTALKNLEGSRVTIRVIPETQTPTRHTVDLVSEDLGLRSEHELRQRAQTLRSSLEAYGLQVNFTAVPTPEPAQVTAVPAKELAGKDRRLKSSPKLEQTVRLQP